jgi:hypothetical protein
MSNIKRLIILLINIKKRKYVRIQLKNSNSFKVRFKIFNQNEKKSYDAFEDRILKKENKVKILFFNHFY